MNNQDERKPGGPYIPSARRSIHDPDGGKMGAYGVNTKRADKPSKHVPRQDVGTDEVDNIMSKFIRQTSPLPRHKPAQRKGRSNSVDFSDLESSDDDEEESNNHVHQSLPSDFFKANNSASFSESSTIRKQLNKSNERSFEEQSTSASYQERLQSNGTSQEKSKSCLQIMIFLAAAIGISTALYSGDFLNSIQETIIIYDELKFDKDMNRLGEKYKINDNTILEVQSGISTISERNDTGSFIFVYNGNSPKFNHLQFKNFMLDIASTTSRYLRNNTVNNQPTTVYSSELTMHSHSELMTKYRHDVARTGVMLVNDVNRIPSKLAMAFHYFCDEYNPLVAKSAIFFTLNLASCSNYPDQKSSHNDIEKCLAKVWDTVPKDNIKPLLARVVNVVIDVTDFY